RSIGPLVAIDRIERIPSLSQDPGSVVIAPAGRYGGARPLDRSVTPRQLPRNIANAAIPFDTSQVLDPSKQNLGRIDGDYSILTAGYESSCTRRQQCLLATRWPEHYR